MLLADAELSPMRELARRVEGLSGRVRLRWRVEPRFGYGERAARLGRRAGVPVASTGGDAIAVQSWNAGEPELTPRAIEDASRSPRARRRCWPSARRSRSLSSSLPRSGRAPARRDNALLA
jgi:hypothetical protein